MPMTQVAAAIDAIGSVYFGEVVTRLCLDVTHFDSAFVCAFFRNHDPIVLHHNLANDAAVATIEPYLRFAYPLDPFYDLFKEGISDSVVFLRDCAPDDFKNTEYFKTFYDDIGLLDECALFVSFGGEASVVFSLGQRTLSNERQIAADTQTTRMALEHLLPVVVALCRRHWPSLTPTSLSTAGRFGHHVEKSFERFGSSVLSQREADIVRLILKGHSSKSIARLLGNSPDTVKVHRKRIYAKMGVASQGELFSIFLNALKMTPPNATADPLMYTDFEPTPDRLD